MMTNLGAYISPDSIEHMYQQAISIVENKYDTLSTTTR